ncbi:MAG: cysteine methyltransferase [Caldilineaceae bacterium]|nr:cysteine methyltransferase [Caldilineaceae bacterium]
MNPPDAKIEAEKPSTYARIYLVVRQIPAGRVANYGQIAAIVGGCTPRMVGYAMAAAMEDDVPWQRVINAQGKISLRADSGGALEQRQRLEDEGVRFDADGRVDFRRFRWGGPEVAWLIEHGFDPATSWTPEEETSA